MDLLDFLDPVSLEKPDEYLIARPNLFGKEISINTPSFSLSTLSIFNIAILGVPEDRNSNNRGASLAPEKIRAQLYQLHRLSSDLKILDLGNIKQGNTFNDTYVALREVLNTLFKHNIIVILIGGTQELTVPAFQCFEQHKQSINLVTIDRTIDIIKDSVKINSDSYLAEILFKKRMLFKYCNLGNQLHLTDRQNIDLIDKLYQESYRMGEVRTNISLVEPILRDSDLVSFDISSVRQADAPGYYNPSPSGFNTEESCQLARYSGLSDRVTFFGLFEINPKYDEREQTSKLAAQMIWYFLDGYSCRNTEIPTTENSNFKTFIVGHSDLDHEITFYKSLVSERWWMEIPNPKTKEPVLVSCSYSDYKAACNQEVPDLWWKSYQKLS